MKLTTRIMMLVAAITLLMGILTVVLSGPVIKQGFRAMDKEWIESLTTSLAEGIAHDTINGNAVRARQLLEAVVRRNKELDYAYVVDFDQRLFTHTFRDGFPEKLLDMIRADQAHQIDHHHSDQIDSQMLTRQHVHSIKLKLDGAGVTDISYPIVEGMSARLHLGLNEKADEALVRAVDQKLVMIIFALGMFGIVLAFPFSRQLTKPLERFGQLMQDYGGDKLKDQVDIPQGSLEIQRLGDAFNQMIKARTHAEDATKASQEQVQLLLNSTGEAIYGVDMNGDYTFANPACARAVGYDSVEELLGRNMHEVMHHTRLDGSPYPVEECRMCQAHLKCEHTHVDDEVFWRKDGTSFPVECSSYPINHEGKTIGSVVTFNDITERRRAVSDLSLFKDTLDQTLDCVFMFEPVSLKFIYMNQGALEQVGYSREELMYMTPVDIKPEFTIERFRELLDPLVSGEERSLFFETIHCRKDGISLPVEIFLQYVVPTGKSPRFVAVVRDITERKTAETELTKHREHLEELVEERTKELHDVQDELVRKGRLATLGQLTATVSHELRNPLGAMRPSLFVIQRQVPKGDKRLQDAIERLDRNIRRCDHIIDELLDFTRITNLEPETRPLDDWLKAVVDEQEIPQSIVVNKELGLDNRVVAFDPSRLRRAVINVLDNACQAMTHDDSEVEQSVESQLNIVTRENIDRIEIVISDTGSGIPEDVLPKIFEPLYSTKGFGVGLGMSTVKQIMEQHAGGIEVNSEEGKGTSVTLWLSMNLARKDGKGIAA